jgi:hypothetical protein
MPEINGKNLVKISHKKLIQSGNFYESYVYTKPYAYNFIGSKNTGTRKNVLEDRKDFSIKRTRDHIRRIVNANSAGKEFRPIFITYTFAENVQNLGQANSIWTVFSRRFNRYVGYNLKYLCVVEFQKRGAIHYHVVYFDLVYIPKIKVVVSSLWGKGFVKIIAIRKVQNLGAYVSKYLQKGVIDKRLCGKKAYFISRGLIMPECIRDEDQIDLLLSRLPPPLFQNTFESERYGTVKYSTIKTQ